MSVESDRPVERLVLASGSPRRRELLSSLDLEFEVRPVDLDETRHEAEEPTRYVERLAREKAAEQALPGEVVLGADTVVVLDGEVLGKPMDEAEARQVLGRLVERRHTVLTGVALVEGSSGRTVATVERSEVEIGAMSRKEIAWYVTTGEPMDKAGSYAIQGLGALFVDRVHGNYTNVVGLPLPATYRLFRELGLDLLDFGRD